MWSGSKAQNTLHDEIGPELKKKLADLLNAQRKKYEYRLEIMSKEYADLKAEMVFQKIGYEEKIRALDEEKEILMSKLDLEQKKNEGVMWFLKKNEELFRENRKGALTNEMPSRHLGDTIPVRMEKEFSVPEAYRMHMEMLTQALTYLYKEHVSDKIQILPEVSY